MAGDARAEEERSLVQACQQGDRQAFRFLFERYRAMVFRVAYRFTGSPDDAADLSQEIFVRIFERIGSFRQECRFSTWLYRLTVNACLNRRSPSSTVGLDDLPREPVDETGDPALLFDRGQIGEAMEQALRALPESLRVVFLLVALEEQSYAEVAETLGLTAEAVRMRMSRARQQLRTLLHDREGAVSP